MAKPEIYVHDWCDAEAIDRWLYRRYPAWEQAMITKLRIWLAWPGTGPQQHGVPLVFGEGWVGYTPRDGRFEEGPIGAEFCRLAVDESTRVGPGAPSSAPTPPRSTPCGPTSTCSSSATTPSGAAPCCDPTTPWRPSP